eukprot:553917_1
MFNCPLTTTSSFEVIANYTHAKNGMVIELASDALFRAKYFPISKLSDYPNEKECILFGNTIPVQICNIIEVNTGFEYKSILSAMNRINAITSQRLNSTYTNIPPHLQSVLVQIIRDQYSSLDNSNPLSENIERYYNLFQNNTTNKIICCNDCYRIFTAEEIISLCVNNTHQYLDDYLVCKKCYNNNPNEVISNKSSPFNHKESFVKREQTRIGYGLNKYFGKWYGNVSDLMNPHLNSIRQTNAETDKICVDGSVKFCSSFSRLNAVISQYQVENTDIDQNQQITRQLLDDYLHLLSKHNTEKDFLFITNTFGKCKAVKRCHHLRRHTRDRNNIQNEMKINAHTEIFDKIHCHFMHYDNVAYQLLDRYRLKCSQILPNAKMLATKTKYGKYSFGKRFIYGYPGENMHVSHGQTAEIFSLKYKHLKEELLTNEIFVATTEQFKLEYRKAKMHLNSQYCRANFIEWTQYRQNILIQTWKISVENILSLMFYCNYDRLQNELSKTYRESTDKFKNHKEFYHLGKMLKITVHKYGVEIRDG